MKSFHKRANNNRPFTFGGFVILLLFSISGASGQWKETVNVELVEIFVSAVTSNGQPIEDLNAGDFVLKVQGKATPITNFTRVLHQDSDVPLTIVFLVDTSGSMEEKGRTVRKIDLARSFAMMIVKEIKSNDRIQVNTFNTLLTQITPMTSDIKQIETALSKVDIQPKENRGTALIASVDVTASWLENAFGRRIILLLSDGENNVSGPKLDDLFEKLNSKDITVFSVGTTDIRDWEGKTTHFNAPIAFDTVDVPLVKPTERRQKAKRLLQLLAENTGGYAVFPGEKKEIPRVLEKVRSVLRSQYMVGFKLQERDSHHSMKQLELQCRRKGVHLRYRKKYFL